MYTAKRQLIAIGVLASALAPPHGAAAASAALPNVTWKREDSLSAARYALAAASTRDGSIYAIGGAESGAEGDHAVGTVEIYARNGRTWRPGPTLPRGGSRLAAATGGDGRIYAIGGINSAGFTDFAYALTPGDDQWVAVAPMPTARQLLGAATGRDGRIYALGGHNLQLSPETDGALDILEIYDPASNTWTAGAPLPTARYDAGAATGSDGRIYAIGGLGGGVYNALDVVEAYSPATNTWTTVAPLPSRRALVDAVAGPDGLIYAIGGCELVFDAAGNPIDCADSTRVDVYSPATNRWRTVRGTSVVHREGAVARSGQRLFAIGGHTDVVESTRPR
jgi:N-acetylneuraminic acid mutarotase